MRLMAAWLCGYVAVWLCGNVVSLSTHVTVWLWNDVTSGTVACSHADTHTLSQCHSVTLKVKVLKKTWEKWTTSGYYMEVLT